MTWGDERGLCYRDYVVLILGEKNRNRGAKKRAEMEEMKDQKVRLSRRKGRIPINSETHFLPGLGTKLSRVGGWGHQNG